VHTKKVSLVWICWLGTVVSHDGEGPTASIQQLFEREKELQYDVDIRHRTRLTAGKGKRYGSGGG
jgi:hypothetical protein